MVYFTAFTIDICAGNSESCITKTISLKRCNTASSKSVFCETLGFRGDHSRVLQNIRAYLRKRVTLKKKHMHIYYIFYLMIVFKCVFTH